MSHTQAYTTDAERASLELVVDADDYVRRTFPRSVTPFRKTSLFRIFYRGLVILLLRLTEIFTQKRLKIICRDSFLGGLAPETKAFLAYLSKNEIITSWRFNRLTPGLPPIAMFDITPAKFVTASGRQLKIIGSAGSGVGKTLDRAAVVALAELVERISCCDWSHRRDFVSEKLVSASKHGKYISTDIFSFFSPDQRNATTQIKIDSETTCRWLPGIDEMKNKSVLLPAQALYTFYNQEYRNEPFILGTHSSGAAVQVNRITAKVNAALELIERDAFLLAWYHKKKCRVLTSKSIQLVLPETKEKFSTLALTGAQIYVIDITSQLGIPTFCGVLTNPGGIHEIAVTAAADTDTRTALKKITEDVFKFFHGLPVVINQTAITKDFRYDAVAIDSFSKRHLLWNDIKMLPYLDFFLAGERVSAEDVLCDYQYPAESSPEEKWKILKAKCTENKVRLFSANMDSPLSRYAGLKVVRALSPDLIPMFYNEQLRPLGLRRFTHNQAGEELVLNKVPHPFM